MYKYEEKLEIVESFKSSGIKIKEFAPTWNVSIVTLRKWVKAYDKYGKEGLKDKRRSTKKEA